MKNEWKEYEFDVPMENGLYLICYTSDRDDYKDDYQFVETAYWLNQGTVLNDLGYGDEVRSKLELTPMVRWNNVMGKYNHRVITQSGFYEFNPTEGLDFTFMKYCLGVNDIYYIKLDDSKVPFEKPLFIASND